MTEQEIAELVRRIRHETKQFYGMSIEDEPCESELFVLREDERWLAADALEALQASYESACTRADEAESRVTFYESELVKTAMALAKITDELRALREAGK